MNLDLPAIKSLHLIVSLKYLSSDVAIALETSVLVEFNETGTLREIIFWVLDSWLLFKDRREVVCWGAAKMIFLDISYYFDDVRSFDEDCYVGISNCL